MNHVLLFSAFAFAILMAAPSPAIAQLATTQSPLAIACLDTNGTTERVFELNSAVPGTIVYEFRSGAEAPVAITFNPAGGFTGGSATAAQIGNCNVSLTAITQDGRAFLAGGAPSGLLSFFDASECPTAWTKQVAPNLAGTPSAGVILCRKD